MTDPLNLHNKPICNTKLSFGQYFNKGIDGYIYNVNETFYNKNVLAKIIKTKTNHGRSINNKIKKEIYFMTIASEADISPKIYKYVTCNINNQEHVIILMEKYGDGTFADLMNKIKNMNKQNTNTISLIRDIQVKMNELFDNLYKLKIKHGDIHASNILYKFTSKTSVELKLIDFGYSRHFNNNEQIYRENRIISTLSGNTSFYKNMININNIIRSR